MRKWYAYLEEMAKLMPLKQGLTKVSKLQQDVNPDTTSLGQPHKLSPIGVLQKWPQIPILRECGSAMPLPTDWNPMALQGINPGDQHRQDHHWREWKQHTSGWTTGQALILAVENDAKVIYIKSYATFKGLRSRFASRRQTNGKWAALKSGGLGIGRDWWR